jgi:hypothetical protein
MPRPAIPTAIQETLQRMLGRIERPFRKPSREPVRPRTKASCTASVVETVPVLGIRSSITCRSIIRSGSWVKEENQYRARGLRAKQKHKLV